MVGTPYQYRKYPDQLWCMHMGAGGLAVRVEIMNARHTKAGTILIIYIQGVCRYSVPSETPLFGLRENIMKLLYVLNK